MSVNPIYWFGQVAFASGAILASFVFFFPWAMQQSGWLKCSRDLQLGSASMRSSA